MFYNQDVLENVVARRGGGGVSTNVVSYSISHNSTHFLVGCANSSAMESPKWDEAFLVKCVSGTSHVTPKWNVSNGMCHKIYQLI